ncbi:MAG: methylated-DNA--[protein]-cysteine S-methyltransferase [bacterium]|nr:methylated-DNA--[protein]-cysteine S-methyltransferase [bacterium]
MSVRYRLIETPVDEIWIAWSEQGLVSLGFAAQPKGAQIDRTWAHDPKLECQAIDQVLDYFAGKRRVFDVALAPEGTLFQKRVWKELAKIPFGETTTYGEIARRIGQPAASRAVGAANGQNPIAIVLPCHRVVGKNGKLTGFAGGLDKKEKLLRFEQDQLEFAI